MKKSEKLKVNSEKYANAKGITLIALIITIIVMLILVAVSIRIALTTGLFELAGKATGDWKTTQDAEAELGNGKVNIDGTVYNSIDEYVATIGGENTGGGETVTAGQKVTSNSEYIDSTGKKAVIPAGFTVSGVKNDTVDETTIDGGLVIYLIPEGETVDWTDGEEVAEAQKIYDQFVWIPIKNTTDENAQDINDMYICQGKTADNGTCTITVENGVAICTNTEHSVIVDDTAPESEQVNKNTLMAGRLYATTTGEKFEEDYTEVYTSGSGFREPDTVSSYDGNSTYLGYLQGILGTTGYETEANFKDNLQNEYNEVVKSVYVNQGFYVGRYETSGMAQAETSYDVAVVAGTLPSVQTDWYHMYAQQKNYAKANSLTVGSTMIQGAAYDQVMKFVNTASYSVTSARNVGYSFSDRYNTGSQSTDQSKNIFDLEGNVRAWTAEVSNTNIRVSRGGNYGSGSASCRYGTYPGNSISDVIGSTCQLYIK